MNNSYNVHRVNKFNLTLLVVFSVLLALQVMVVDGIGKGLPVAYATGGASLVALLVYFFKLPQKITSIIIPLSPVISATCLGVIKKGSLTVIVVYLVAICMAALYFNTRNIVTVGVLVNLIFIITNFVLDLPVMGEAMGVREPIIQLGVMNTGIAVLYFLAKWGNEYVQMSIKNEALARQVLDELKLTFSSLEQTAVVLNQNIASFKENLDGTKQSSDIVTKAIDEIAKGVEEQAVGITTISSQMNDAQQMVKNTHAKSTSIEQASNEVNQMVEKNGKEIVNMHQSMETIHKAVQHGLTTVVELGQNMNFIHTFLASITQIAEQTNLLALNAAIEAARAGESGKGFAVVAVEIRKLADESNKTANEISHIVTSLQVKATEAVETVEAGNIAAKEGSELINRLHDSTTTMMKSFANMQKDITEEYGHIEELSRLFNSIYMHLENNAAIMQEHSATTEQVLGTVEEQHIQIAHMAKTICEIETLSGDLRRLAEQ